MKTKKNKYCFFYLSIILFFPVLIFSQPKQEGFKAWKLTDYSGELKTRGFYREYEITNPDYQDNQYSSYLMGGVRLNTKSFILHPNFFSMDVDADYFPETSRNNYIIMTDNAEVRTTKKLDARAIVLSQKKIFLTPFMGFHNSYQNREYLTDIRSDEQKWGGAISFRNKFLPVSATYRERKWNQTLVATNLQTKNDERAFQVHANKSFFSHDRHEAGFSHTEAVFQNQLFSTGGEFIRFKNVVDDFRINNNVPFDEGRKYLFTSAISTIIYHGDRKLNVMRALENMTIKLPQRFILTANYTFNQSRQVINKMTSHTLHGALSNKLFLSLNTRIFYEYSKVDHTIYNENANKKGLDIYYTKKIPLQGRLTSSYSFSQRHQKTESEPSLMNVNNEEYLIADGTMVLLRKNYVQKESVVIRDSTGNIIFSENADYYLIERQTYLEIVRIPGGRIANHTTVLIDYTVIQQPTNSFVMENHSFSMNVSLFKSKVNIFYRFSMQDHKNVNNTDYRILNYFTQKSVGGNLDFGFFSAGTEYEEFNSSLFPYKRMRYFINLQKSFREKLICVINGNYMDYFMVNEKQYQNYSDVSARLTYLALKQIRMNLDLMYRNQKGKGIDLNLASARYELTYHVGELYFTAGMELYKRNYVGNTINFKGMNVMITRRF